MILSFSVATYSPGVALLDDGNLLAQAVAARRKEFWTGSSARLFSSTSEVLASAGVGAGDISGLAVTSGPGSHTGLRAGAAFVKGLGLSLDLPIAPVPTLDAMALAGGAPGRDIFTVLRHRGLEYHVGRFVLDSGEVRMTEPARVLGKGDIQSAVPGGALRIGAIEAGLEPEAGVFDATPTWMASLPLAAGLIGEKILASARGMTAQSFLPSCSPWLKCL